MAMMAMTTSNSIRVNAVVLPDRLTKRLFALRHRGTVTRDDTRKFAAHKRITGWHPNTPLVWHSARRWNRLAIERRRDECSPLRASVAQLDRASDFGSEGCRFKSCRMHHFL